MQLLTRRWGLPHTRSNSNRERDQTMLDCLTSMLWTVCLGLDAGSVGVLLCLFCIIMAGWRLKNCLSHRASMNVANT